MGTAVGEQEALALGVLQDGSVAEVILLGGLDAEGSLAPHAQHRLVDVQRAHVLQLRQADVQRAEGTWGQPPGGWRQTPAARATSRAVVVLSCPHHRIAESLVLEKTSEVIEASL